MAVPIRLFRSVEPSTGSIHGEEEKSALRVDATGKRRSISVPVALARDLHNFLRLNRVRSAPPEPSYTGFDNIELAYDIDVDGVQTLLNSWNQRN